MYRSWFVLAFSALPLGGCASMAAMQRPVVAKDLGQSVCPSPEEVRTIQKMPTPDRGAYRDVIIGDCVKAIDRQYQAFKIQLHEESSSTRLTTAIAATGSAAIATFAKADIARRLAAGNAFVLGTEGAIDKNVFFDQTLPALEASMDGRRDIILTRIIQAQRGDPDGKSYSLVSAGYDLDAYQNAGNLYLAVAELTKTAVATAQTASKERQDAQIDLGPYNPPGPGISARFDVMYGKVRGYKEAADGKKIDNILAAIGFKTDPNWDFERKQAELIGEMKRRELSKDQAQQAAYATELEGLIK